MAVTAITLTKFEADNKKQQSEKATKFSAKRYNVGQHRKQPTPYQRNALHHIREVLRLHKSNRRAEVYNLLKKIYYVEVTSMRHRAKGGVGSYTWMPRKGCYRVQVGASKIDTRKPCFRYAPCIEIYDTWNSKSL